MISPEESCLSPGAYGAFAISEAFLYRTKVPRSGEHFALYQFQEWMKRQNGNPVVTREGCEEPDSAHKLSSRFSFEDPDFCDDSQVTFVFFCISEELVSH